MMGTWFMGTALGNLIAGLAGGGFQGMSVGEMFSAVAKVTGAAGLILLLFARPLRRLMGGQGSLPVEAIPVGSDAAVAEGVERS
jgi:POT family proton-dependent oligopeptide transporter